LANPISQNIWTKLITTIAVATTPKSAGPRILARTTNTSGGAVREAISFNDDHLTEATARPKRA
jgi:hypothetical protein